MASIRHLLPTPEPKAAVEPHPDVQDDSLTSSGSEGERDIGIRDPDPADEDLLVGDRVEFKATVDSTNLGLFLGQTMPVVPMWVESKPGSEEKAPFYYLKELWQFFDTPFGRDVEIDVRGRRVLVHYVPHLSSVQLYKRASQNPDPSTMDGISVPGVEPHESVSGSTKSGSRRRKGDDGSMDRSLIGAPRPLTVPAEPTASAWGVSVGIPSHTHTQEPKSWSSVLTAPKSSYLSDFPALSTPPATQGESPGSPNMEGLPSHQLGEPAQQASPTVTGDVREECGPELVYSFHETETPDRRIPLPEKIAELTRKKNGFNLLRLKSTELDPRSWIAVHWVPILCHTHTRSLIRGSFITYYRLEVNTMAPSWPQDGPMSGTPKSPTDTPKDEDGGEGTSKQEDNGDLDSAAPEASASPQDARDDPKSEERPQARPSSSVETQTSNQPLYNCNEEGPAQAFPESTSSVFDEGLPQSPELGPSHPARDDVIQVETVAAKSPVSRASASVAGRGQSPIRLRRSILRDDDNVPVPGLRRSVRDDDSLFGRPYPRTSHDDGALIEPLNMSGCLDFIGFVPHKVLESTWYQSRDPLLSHVTAKVPSVLLQSVADWLTYIGCMPNDFRHCFLSDNLSELLQQPATTPAASTATATNTATASTATTTARPAPPADPAPSAPA